MCSGQAASQETELLPQTGENKKISMGLETATLIRTGYHKKGTTDFPGSPVVKTLRFHCRVHGFDPWWGN